MLNQLYLLQALRKFIYINFLLFCFLGLNAQTHVLDSLKIVAKTQKADSNRVHSYNTISHSSLNLNYDSALIYGRKAMKLSQRIGFESGEAQGLLRMGNAYNYSGRGDSASWAFTLSYELYESINNFSGMGSALNNMGLMYRNMADYPKSLSYLMRSLELKKAHGSEVEMGVAYQNIGIVFAIQGDYETANEYISKAVSLYGDNNDSSKYYSALIDQSSLFRDMNKPDQAIFLLLKTFRYHKRENNKTSVAICLYNLGYTSLIREDYEEALDYFKDANKEFSDLGNKVRLTGTFIQLTRTYLQLNELKSAEQMAREGLTLVSSISSPIQQQRLHELLARVLYARGKYAEAYDQRLLHEHLKDSVENEEQQLKIKEIQTNYQGEINKREIAELKRKRIIENYVYIGIILIALIFGLMVYSRFRIRKRANDALKEKNIIIQHSLDEKEVLLREIHHRVQNNLQFVSSMLNLQARRVSDQTTLDVLKDCKLRIQSMALIHQKLYQEDSLKGIDILNYTQNLIESLMQSYQIDNETVKVSLDVEPLHLDINSAIPIGLILNELITNSFKYAFDHVKEGLLHINLREKDNILTLEVKDNGPGLPADFDMEGNNSFGLKLVRSLSTKIKAEILIDSSDGTSVMLKIKEYEKIDHGG